MPSMYDSGARKEQRAGPASDVSSRALAVPFGDLDVDSLSPPMRKLIKALLLYKTMFAGPWFEALSMEEDPETRALYRRIMTETTQQAQRAADLLHRWDATDGHEQMEGVTNQVLKRLLDDMLSLKKSSTEVFLGAGIGAPTEELRREFLDLADIDRRHAESLRAALGVHLPNDLSAGSTPRKGYAGVRAGPFPPGTLSGTLRSTLEEARVSGHEPTRIVLSSMALRHLRDEGSVAPHQGDVFGLPADIDFSWEDEAFTIISRGRVSLAEIVTEMEAGGKAAADAG
jgi:hypothetical protein